MVWRGNAHHINFRQLQNSTVVFGYMFFIVRVEANNFGRWIKALVIYLLLFHAAVHAGVFARMAVPHIAHSDSGHILSASCQFLDHTEVGLAPATNANESHSQSLIGAKHPVVARGRKNHGGSSSGACKKLTALRLGLGHGWTP